MPLPTRRDRRSTILNSLHLVNYFFSKMIFFTLKTLPYVSFSPYGTDVFTLTCDSCQYFIFSLLKKIFPAAVTRHAPARSHLRYHRSEMRQMIYAQLKEFLYIRKPLSSFTSTVATTSNINILGREQLLMLGRAFLSMDNTLWLSANHKSCRITADCEAKYSEYSLQTKELTLTPWPSSQRA